MNNINTTKTPKAHGKTLLALVLIGWTLFGMGCASPLTLSPKTRGDTGTLSLAVPHIAAWAARQASPQNLDTAPSRSYIVADRVVVEVKDASGAAVIPPATIDLTMVTDYSPAAPATPEAITDIPVGTDYTVVVSVYNLAVSSTVPVVRGQASGITVTLAQTTPVAITCLPVSPTPIVVDGGPWTLPLAPNGEHWYALEVTAGSPYYFVNNVPFALFDADGAIISTPSLLPFVPSSTGTIYVGVVDFDKFSSFSAQGSSVLNVTSTEPKTNEGSAAAPEPLSLNTAHNFNLGPSQGAYSASYYSFTTSAAGEYFLDTDLVYLYASLYSDAAFSSVVLPQGSPVEYGLSLGNLAANTTYYLKLRTGFTNNQHGYGQVMDATGVATHYEGQGTPAAPQTLAIGTTYAAQVGTHVYDFSSYYLFTTGAGTNYAIDVSSFGASGNELTLSLFSTGSFSSNFTSRQFRSDGTLFVKLTPNTTYYLKAANDYNAVRRNSLLAFNLVLRATSTVPDVVDGSLEAPSEVVLNTSRTFKVANYGSGYPSYYRFTTASAGDYALDTKLNGMDVYLYSDPGFATSVSSSFSVTRGTVFGGLSAGTTYYLKLVGSSSAYQSSLGQIVDAATMAASYGADGSVASPAVVTVGTPFPGRVGEHSYDSKSYYAFTTGPGLEYFINLSGISSSNRVVAVLYSSPMFVGQVTYQYFPNSSPMLVTLMPNTTYYLQVLGQTMDSAAYGLAVTTAPPPSFTPLPVSTAGAAYQVGSITVPYEVLWYEADVVPGTTYWLSWDDQYQGSGTFSRDIDVSAYHANRSTSYFTNADSGYTSSYSITIPAGETKLYVRVRSYGGSSNTGTFGIKLY